MRFTWSNGLLRAVSARLALRARMISFVGSCLCSRVLRGVWWLWCSYIAGIKKPASAGNVIRRLSAYYGAVFLFESVRFGGGSFNVTGVVRGAGVGVSVCGREFSQFFHHVECV